MNTYTIASIAGDGIGKEVVPAAWRVLKTLEKVQGDFELRVTDFPWSCDYYLEHGRMMPEDGLKQLEAFDAVFLGAVGHPDLVPDHISLWGLLINIRRGFEQQINVRPSRQFEGLTSPLANPNQFNLMVVRENSEGEYSEVGGRMYSGEEEIAIQNNVFSKKAVKAAMEYAFQLAKDRSGHVTSATKSNGIVFSMPFWDEVFNEVKENYPDIETRAEHIDALAAAFVTKPETMDVVVGSNLFGDILTDIGAALMGSIGIAPAANININGKYPSMFEPVHGSAPDIEGKGLANPVGQLWTAQMMLDHLGENTAAQTLMNAIEYVIKQGTVTKDLGGNASTEEVVKAVEEYLISEKGK